MAMVKHAPDVRRRFGGPDDVAKRHPLPQAHAQRRANVVAGHDLEKPHRVFLPELQERLEIQRVALRPRERVAHQRIALGIRNDVELPSFTFQANLEPLGQGQLVRQGIATLDRAKIILRREIPEISRRLIEEGLIGIRPGGQWLQRGNTDCSELQEVTPRHLEVLPVKFA